MQAQGRAAPPAPGDLRDRIRASLEGPTRTQAAITAYMLNNIETLAFETSASVAERIGVSEASISRYCRALGVRHFKDLKAHLRNDLRDTAWLIGDRLRAVHDRWRNVQGTLAASLEREIAAIVANYELAVTPAFARTVERLARTPAVYVAGFQTERGLAAYLVHCLQYLRPGVRLVDLEGGHFAEVLLDDPGSACLVLIDGRRYSRLTRRLAREACGAGVPVTLITDRYCPWGGEVADDVLPVQTDLDQFWDATAPMASLIGLLTASVFQELGPGVETRMAALSGLYHAFTGHAGYPRGALP